MNLKQVQKSLKINPPEVFIYCYWIQYGLIVLLWDIPHSAHSSFALENFCVFHNVFGMW